MPCFPLSTRMGGTNVPERHLLNLMGGSGKLKDTKIPLGSTLEVRLV